MTRAAPLLALSGVALIASVAPIAAPAGADFALATSAEAFVERQLAKFALPGDYPPGYESARLVQTYDVPPPEFQGADHPLAHRADVYDSSLALLVLVAAGDLARAREIADGLRLVQDTDPFGDGRLRASYYANDLLAPGNAGPSIDSSAATVGNVAWSGIALARFVAAAADAAFLSAAEREPYLDAARAAAAWIDDHTRQDDATGGYSLGEDAAGAPLFGTPHARSTEHNTDAWALARHLAWLDPGEPRWSDVADHAAGFVAAMYDAAGARYWTGTRDDGGGGLEINPTPVPADAQTWTALAGVDAAARRAAAIRSVAETPPGDPQALRAVAAVGGGTEFEGLRFSTGGDHVQVEETGGWAMALAVGAAEGWLAPQGAEPPAHWTDARDAALAELDAMRTGAPGADPGGVGLVATPWPGGARSGFEAAGDPPTYPNLRHVASSAWSGLAARVAAGDAASNPLRPLPEPGAIAIALGALLAARLRRARPR